MPLKNRSRKDSRNLLLHITTVPDTLGFLRGQLKFMRELGFEVSVMTSPGNALNRFVEEEGVTAEAIRMERRITPLKDLGTLGRMTWTLRRLRPTIVHASTPKGGLLGTIAARLAGVPVVVYHVRGLVFTGSNGPQRFLLRTTERIACALAHRVICVSHSVREALLAEGLCAPEKTVVILSGSSNGVDAHDRFNPSRFSPDKRSSLRRRLGIPESARVIGFIGRLVRDKGIIELASAWKNVSKLVPEAWLLVVGPWESRDSVSPAIRAGLESDPRVVMAGEHPDTSPFYTAMDIVVLPTYREGFPNVPLEAAAMNLPTVVSDATGCTDAVVDGVTGTLVPVRNSEALADAIRAYLADEGLRKAHGEAGRARALSEFEPRRVWVALYEEYLRLMQTRGISRPMNSSL